MIVLETWGISKLVFFLTYFSKIFNENVIIYVKLLTLCKLTFKQLLRWLKGFTCSNLLHSTTNAFHAIQNTFHAILLKSNIWSG